MSGWTSTRTKLEIVMVIATVIGTAAGCYEAFAPLFVEQGREQLAKDVSGSLQAEGIDIEGAQERILSGDVGSVISAAVAQVREVQDSFQMRPGDTLELTEHQILFTMVGKGTHPIKTRVRISGYRIDLAIGEGRYLPQPAENCYVSLVRQHDWENVRSGTSGPRADFRLKCFDN